MMQREAKPTGVIVECGCQKRSILVRLEPGREPNYYVGTCHSCRTQYEVSVHWLVGKREGE